MIYKEFEENLKQFMERINQIPNSNNEQNAILIKRYIEQNVSILNDVLITSVNHLKRLQHAESANDIICTQARFTNEISNKLSLSAQRFLNASLGHIADYNDWLKAHCDLSS